MCLWFFKFPCLDSCLSFQVPFLPLSSLLSVSFFQYFLFVLLFELYFLSTLDFSYAVSLSKHVFFCRFYLHIVFRSHLDVLFYGKSSLGISCPPMCFYNLMIMAVIHLAKSNIICFCICLPHFIGSALTQGPGLSYSLSIPSTPSHTQSRNSLTIYSVNKQVVF